MSREEGESSHLFNLNLGPKFDSGLIVRSGPSQDRSVKAQPKIFPVEQTNFALALLS